MSAKTTLKWRMAAGLAVLTLLAASTVNAQFTNYGNAFKNPGPNECFTLTLNAGNQGGAVYNLTPIDLTNSFRIRLFVNLGANDGGADGMAFLLRSNPTAIPVGNTGGSLGVTGNGDSTLFVEMDTWDNTNNFDPPVDHLCIMRSDVIHGVYTNLSSPVPATPTSGNIEDNQDHELSVSWDAPTQELKVYFDCNLRTKYIGDIVNNVFNGNPVVYYGVSAATGGATNLHTACFEPFIDLPDTINASCGDTLLNIQLSKFSINCSSIDADGTDFRLADSSKFNGNPSSVRYLAVMGAQGINCNAINKTNHIRVKLLKPLNYGDYTLVIKKGNTLSTLSPFCSNPDLNDYSTFDVPEFTTIHVKVRGNVPVQIDDVTHDVKNPNVIGVCLPTNDPFPLLKARSAKAVGYNWVYGIDTIQRIDSVWATEPGLYTVYVTDAYGCRGTDKVTVEFVKRPEFFVEIPPYCDTILGGDPNNLPKQLIVPEEPSGGIWRWDFDYGPPGGFTTIHAGDTLNNVFSGRYKLIYQDTVVIKGIPGCVTEYAFELTRKKYPPDAPLNVQIQGKLYYCSDGDPSSALRVWNDILKPNFKAKPGYGPNTPYIYQWFYEGQPIAGADLDSIVATNQGQYIAYVKDQYGCVGADTVDLGVSTRYPAFGVYCKTLLNDNGKIFWDPISTAIFYEISFDGGLSWRRVDSSVVEVGNIGATYGVKVRAIFDDACRESEISNFYPCSAEISIPNVFTPNADGINDVFYVQSLEFFPGSRLQIFDRWGLTVYESNDYQNDWDGGDVPEGTYFYILQLNDHDRTIEKGYFSLMR